MSITGVVGLEMLCNTSRGIYNSTAMLEACDIFIVDDDNSVDLVLWEMGSGDRNFGVAWGWLRSKEERGGKSKRAGGKGSVCSGRLQDFVRRASWVGSHVAHTTTTIKKKRKRKEKLLQITCILLERLVPLLFFTYLRCIDPMAPARASWEAGT